MVTDKATIPMPTSYTDLVIEKSNLLLRANMHEAQQEFDEAAELFAKSAMLEAELAVTAYEYNQPDIALVHLISEISCWAAAGDTYRAVSQGQRMLASPTLTTAQRIHLNELVEKLNLRRRSWMASWDAQIAPIDGGPSEPASMGAMSPTNRY
ncbi:MAG: hypothetical protein AAF702_47155 [Chloroflexota bacterium]